MMTDEKAIEVLIKNRMIGSFELTQAMSVAVKKLKQKPCEDAISRQAVLEYIEGSEAELGHSTENELVCQYIKELPPVQPKHTDCVDRKLFCTECGITESQPMFMQKYCRYCGAKMEVEEL